ncbi:Pentatricopeptide repeat-containing protein [Drosera capensis]
MRTGFLSLPFSLIKPKPPPRHSPRINLIHSNYHTTPTTQPHNKHPTTSTNIFTKISLIVAGSPNTRLSPILDEWVVDEELGRKMTALDLRDVVRGLRAKKRFHQALEVSEWMSEKGVFSFSLTDRTIKLDLIGKVHGVRAAETYFNKMADKSDKMHGALLYCYVREGLIDEALCLFQKMKEMGIATSALTYNDIMSLYLNTNRLEKIPAVLSDMKANGVIPDAFSYRMCLKSYGSKSDFASIEKLLDEVEDQQHMLVHWSIYTTAANLYLEAGLKERALHYLKKAEEKVVKKDWKGYNSLLIFYTRLGDKSEILRLWNLKKATSRKLNNADYAITMNGLSKLGEIEEVENLFEEWQSAGTLYDFRVPNWLLIAYTKRGLTQKAEILLEKIINEGHDPIPNSWSIIATGHVSEGNMDKVLECMEKAIALQPQHEGWYPNAAVASSVLSWLNENGDAERMKSFVDSLKRIVPNDGETGHARVKENGLRGYDVDKIIQDLKMKNVEEEDEETKEILAASD